MRKIVWSPPLLLRWLKQPIYEDVYSETIVSISEDDISTIEPYLTDSGKIDNTKAIITLKNNRDFIVNHSYDELTQHKQIKTIKGFLYGN